MLTTDMMKVVYAVVITLVLFVGFTFTYMNSQTVEIQYLSFHKETSLSALLLFTLVAGVVIGYVISVVSSLKSRRKTKRGASETGL